MSAETVLSKRARIAVLFVAFAGLLFDGMELGLMPIAAQSIARDILGDQFTKALGGIWFARLNASLLLGAAVGGIWLGALGDKIGRTKALGVSVLFYSVFCGMGYFVKSLEQMMVLRFLVGLGVGGVWPNGVALVSECWPKISRPIVAGIMGAGINVGIFILSQITGHWHITAESWRWIFGWSALPALLGLAAIWFVPESPRWLAMRGTTATAKPATPLRDLFTPPLLRTMMIGIALGSIPLVGAWAASKWVIPWAESVAGASNPDYKSSVQAWWSMGALLGSFFGAQLASLIGRRFSYFLISLGSTVLTVGLFTLTAPLRPEFVYVAFLQGFVATLFFGWLPLYLPELFSTRVRATGSGIAYNVGRFATAIGMFITTGLVGLFGGDLAKVGATMAFVYALGMIAIWWAPDTTNKSLDD
jgi:SHS family sialic acid transporter-like MFS transporter